MVVGQSTTTVDKIYSYLSIGEDNIGLSVKTQTTTTTNYSFDSQWISTPNVEISTHIISYFNSLSDIQKNVLIYIIKWTWKEHKSNIFQVSQLNR